MSKPENYLDEDGRIASWPSKQESKKAVLAYLAGRFESGRFYSEKEVNALIARWHTFGDYFLLRRGLIDHRFLVRTRNGARYWKDEAGQRQDIAALIHRHYATGHIVSLFRLTGGYGAQTYYLQTESGSYIGKEIENNAMNHPENEAGILTALREAGIPVSEIVPTANGGDLFYSGGRTFHLQRYVEGEIFPHNGAPDWLLFASARLLGKMHKAMALLPALPTGIGQDFFDVMTPRAAERQHRTTLALTENRGDTDIAEAVQEKLRMLAQIKDVRVDLSELTCKNTHGDFAIKQIICGKEKINAVIDFTSACVHPYVFEIIRSYCLADPACAGGTVDIDLLKRYLSCYLEYSDLSRQDIKTMPTLYFYQLLVADYFGQYYAMQNRNKNILLDDAFHAVKLCRWFTENITRLEDALLRG